MSKSTAEDGDVLDHARLIKYLRHQKMFQMKVIEINVI